jgi:hypothetical protein
LVKNHEAGKWVFGLATLQYHGGARHIMPRSISTRPTSEKANVFDSGILLLSLITAQLAFELGKTSDALHSPKGILLDWSMQAQCHGSASADQCHGLRASRISSGGEC